MWYPSAGRENSRRAIFPTRVGLETGDGDGPQALVTTRTRGTGGRTRGDGVTRENM